MNVNDRGFGEGEFQGREVDGVGDRRGEQLLVVGPHEVGKQLELVVVPEAHHPDQQDREHQEQYQGEGEGQDLEVAHGTARQSACDARGVFGSAGVSPATGRRPVISHGESPRTRRPGAELAMSLGSAGVLSTFGRQ